jgi:hypothetical protein
MAIGGDGMSNGQLATVDYNRIIGDRRIMLSTKFIPLIALGLAVGLAGCSAMEAARQEQEKKQQEFVTRVDTAHVWVTTEGPPSGKPYHELGELSYSEPFSPDAIDESKITEKLKKMALDKWPDSIDAIVKVNQDVSADGSTVKVTGEAIQYEDSQDRTALHKMNEGLVVSPNNQ